MGLVVTAGAAAVAEAMEMVPLAAVHLEVAGLEEAMVARLSRT